MTPPTPSESSQSRRSQSVSRSDGELGTDTVDVFDRDLASLDDVDELVQELHAALRAYQGQADAPTVVCALADCDAAEQSDRIRKTAIAMIQVAALIDERGPLSEAVPPELADAVDTADLEGFDA